jgi:hypothetical protein
MTTVQLLSTVFPMYPLTLEGLDRAVRYLIRGGERAPAVA